MKEAENQRRHFHTVPRQQQGICQPEPSTEHTTTTWLPDLGSDWLRATRCLVPTPSKDSALRKLVDGAFVLWKRDVSIYPKLRENFITTGRLSYGCSISCAWFLHRWYFTKAVPGYKRAFIKTLTSDLLVMSPRPNLPKIEPKPGQDPSILH